MSEANYFLTVRNNSGLKLLYKLLQIYIYGALIMINKKGTSILAAIFIMTVTVISASAYTPRAVIDPNASAFSEEVAESVEIENSTVVFRGSFRGRSGHRVSGTVTIRKTKNGYQAVLSRNFRFDGAPDPKLAFGQNGYKRNTLFSRLKSNRGSQVYNLPKRIDPTKYNQFWIWCEQFNTPLAVARI